MPNGFRIGSTFHFNDRIDDDHLYVVVSGLSAPEVVILSITTQRRFSDTSCLLQPSDHPFISRPSCIAYLFAELIAVSELESKLQHGDLTLRETCDSKMLEKIWDGAEKTRQMQGWIREVLVSQGIISE